MTNAALGLGFSLLFTMAAVAACSATSGESSTTVFSTSGGSGSGGSGNSGSTQNGSGGGSFVGSGSSGQGGAGAGCVPPDMLVVLDRTMSMFKRPDGVIPPDTPAGHAETKWYLAI